MVARHQIELLQSIVKKSRSVTANTMATADVCSPLLRALVDRFDCHLADVWSVDPRRRKLILIEQTFKQSSSIERTDVLTVGKSLTGKVVETGRLTRFDDLNAYIDEGREFEDHALQAALGLTRFVSMPILNTANPHQVLCVVNFFPRSQVPYSDKQWSRLNKKLESISSILAVGIEANLRERAFRMATMLSQQMYSHPVTDSAAFVTMRTACSTLAKCCIRAVAGQRAVVYVPDPAEHLLCVQADVDTVDGKLVDCLLAGGDQDSVAPPIVARVFKENREYLAPNISLELDPSDFIDDNRTSKSASCIVIPLQDPSGRCQGVIMCFGATPSGGQRRTRFSYDDIAILEAMALSFVSPLDSLLAAERRRFSQQKLSHELRLPVTTFDKVLATMYAESREGGFRFKHNHFREGRIYVDVMTRLVKDVDILRYGPSNVPLVIQLTDLESDVVMPAKRFTIPLLRKRRVYTWQIDHVGFDKLPKVTLDPGLITQVIFNLLDNAIKYFIGEPLDFRCWIKAALTERHIEIIVEDNGPGIDESQKELIFRHGRRGTNRRANTLGEGLGLWVSRAIAERHGGALFVGNCCKNTQIVMQLPLHRVLSEGSVMNADVAIHRR